MVKKTSFLEKRSVVATFGVLAFLGGISFIKPFGAGNVTGNIISLSGTTNMLQIIGILLLIGSVTLISYAIIKRD